MTDPRLTDPRDDAPLNQPMNRGESFGGMWGWVIGIAAVALVAFVVIAGWSGGTNTAANNPAANTAPATVGNGPVRNVTPPSTTGSGATSPAPAQQPPANNLAR